MLRTRIGRDPYIERRQRLAEARPDAVLVVRGDGPDGVNPNLVYFSGIADPSAVLLLSARGM